MKKHLLTLAAFAATSVAVVASSPFIMDEVAVRGYDRSDSHFAQWASNLVATARASGQLLAAVSNSDITHNYRLTPSDITLQTNTPNIIWYVIHISSVSSNVMFNVSNLTAVASSSDSYNFLAKTASFNNPAYGFSPWAVGVVWNYTNGVRAADTVYDSGQSWNAQNINELWFVSLETIYGFDTNSIAAYIGQFHPFTTTGKFVLATPGGSPSVSQVTLQTEGAPAALVLNSAQSGSTTNILLGSNAETNRTIIWQYAPSLPSQTNWTTIGSANGGEIISWPLSVSSGTFPQGFFRALKSQ